MSLTVLAEAAAARRWGRAGLVVWAWFCWLQFAFMAVCAGVWAVTVQPLWAVWDAVSAGVFAYVALRSSARAARP